MKLQQLESALSISLNKISQLQVQNSENDQKYDQLCYSLYENKEKIAVIQRDQEEASGIQGLRIR